MQQARLEGAGLQASVEWVPNPDRGGKLELLRSLSVFSVPARCGEAFGLYVLEALATGVPVVAPRAGAFPEVLAKTGGGRLHEPEDVDSLVEGLEGLLGDPAAARALGAEGRRGVLAGYSAGHMAERLMAVLEGRDAGAGGAGGSAEQGGALVGAQVERARAGAGHGQ
jgi:glycosyltransferase involved in cell wall biosynthesis